MVSSTGPQIIQTALATNIAQATIGIVTATRSTKVVAEATAPLASH